MARSAAQLAHRMSMLHPLCASCPKPAQYAICKFFCAIMRTPLNPKMQNHYPTLNPKLYNAKISSPFLQLCFGHHFCYSPYKCIQTNLWTLATPHIIKRKSMEISQSCHPTLCYKLYFKKNKRITKNCCRKLSHLSEASSYTMNTLIGIAHYNDESM